MSRLLAAGVACLLVSCAVGRSPSDSPPPQSDGGPLIRPGASESSKAGAETITGVFGADAVEGGCPHLATKNGRYEVRYPSGWSIEQGTFRLIDPNGEIVARGGETITVRGHVADDMASTCQIGQIFIATDVVSISD